MSKQIITSSKTARKQIPLMFRLVKNMNSWEYGTNNLDIGGGPYNKFTDKLAEIGVTNWVYDPYNVPLDVNCLVLETVISAGGADTVTLSNVLNVIKRAEHRQEVLTLAKSHLKANGRCFITVYEGDGNGNRRKTRDGWQEHRKLSTYEIEIVKVFGCCHRFGKILVAYV